MFSLLTRHNTAWKYPIIISAVRGSTRVRAPVSMCTVWVWWPVTFHFSLSFVFITQHVCFWITSRIFVICLWWFSALAGDRGIVGKQTQGLPPLVFSLCLCPALVNRRGSWRKWCCRAPVFMDSIYLRACVLVCVDFSTPRADLPHKSRKRSLVVCTFFSFILFFCFIQLILLQSKVYSDLQWRKYIRSICDILHPSLNPGVDC